MPGIVHRFFFNYILMTSSNFDLRRFLTFSQTNNIDWLVDRFTAMRIFDHAIFRLQPLR
jgi:hypothetical protein